MKKIYNSKEERWAAYREKYRFAGKKPDLEHMIERCKEPSIKKWYPEYYQQVINWIDKDIPFREKLYLFRNQIKEVPVCKTCGNPVPFYNSRIGYHQYCCPECSNSNENKKQLTRENNIQKYGGPAPSCSEEVKAKTRATNLKRYGVEYSSQNKEIYARSIQTRIERYGGVGNASKISKEKYEQTCLEKYGAKNPQASKEFRRTHNYVSPFTRPEVQEKCKRTIIEKCGGTYSVEYRGATSCPEVREAIYRKKRKNKTFNTSKIETKFEEYLKSKDIKYRSQYISDVYPFNCDFYIEEFDLYIELQSSWTHGEHPYNEDQDKEKLDLWVEKSKTSKFYENAIKTWTVRDTTKRQTAKQNNLRYLEIFETDINKAIETFEKYIKEPC